MTDSVTIVEVSPRDGLQNETAPVATADKLTLITMLADAGFTRIEAASFVSPKWVPQMADAAQIMAGVPTRPGLRYAALTPNMKGLDAALAAGAKEIAIFGAASETFSRKNINAGIDESLARFAPVAQAAKAAGAMVRGYVSCVTDCPYDGPTDPAAVARVSDALAAMGCYEISLGDTIGKATPQSTAAMLDAVQSTLPATMLAGHFHDTGGRALDNIAQCMDHGLRVFDASAGGLGGCPYAPGAKGNVASEAVHAMLMEQGVTTGLDPLRLKAAAAFAKSLRKTAP